MDILIYGAGMLGKQVAHLALNHYRETHQICGFIDDTKPAGSEVIGGIQTIGGLGDIYKKKTFSPDKFSVVFAIGYSDMQARRTALDNILSNGYTLTGLIHPAASVEPSATLGAGVIILAGAVVDQYVAIGDACYLHNGSIVGENSIIGINNYLSAGSTMGGSVVVGDDNFFGINATIVNDIQIGRGNFINAGSLIYKPIGDNIRIVEYREQREVRHV